ncbi:hypothetical protein [Paenibacillus sp. D9]|uniref:hypothetical protein n=1 Tax=Paenibacillus sp. D9 TaxID=665792 RepID=UPI000675CEBA|nr:hypothetical protein [Paenibacillus sp. D9]
MAVDPSRSIPSGIGKLRSGEERSIRLKKAGGKAADILYAVFRYALVVGISFIILYPILLKISVAFKDKIDLYDPTIFMGKRRS